MTRLTILAALAAVLTGGAAFSATSADERPDRRVCVLLTDDRTNPDGYCVWTPTR